MDEVDKWRVAFQDEAEVLDVKPIERTPLIWDVRQHPPVSAIRGAKFFTADDADMLLFRVELSDELSLHELADCDELGRSFDGCADDMARDQAPGHRSVLASQHAQVVDGVRVGDWERARRRHVPYMDKIDSFARGGFSLERSPKCPSFCAGADWSRARWYVALYDSDVRAELEGDGLSALQEDEFAAGVSEQLRDSR